jgi:thiol-disulfide isomerase/thioredoxin
MTTRRHLVIAFALAAAAPFAVQPHSVVGMALAADARPFTPAAFEAAKKAGTPILVEVSAPWCPVCKAQKPILAEITAQPRFAKLAVFNVDFDSQKDALRMLGVQKQSTLISFKGGKEVGRSTGITDKARIAGQLERSL